MFYSQCLLSKNGTFGAIWLAAYFSKKLKKSQVTATDISSSVDKILQDEFNFVTYRVLAYLLLGVVRIYSKKVEYLFDDCNEVLVKIKNFVLNNKDATVMESLCAPYFSITLPESFALDAFDLEILEDTSDGNVMPQEEITLKDGLWKTRGRAKYSLDQYYCEEFATCRDTWSAGSTLDKDVLSSQLMDIDVEGGTSHKVSNSQASREKLGGNRFSQHEYMGLETFSGVDEEPPNPVNHQTEGGNTKVPEMVDSDEMLAEASVQKLWDCSFCQEACMDLETFGLVEEERGNPVEPVGEHHQTDGQLAQLENEMHDVVKDYNQRDAEPTAEKLHENGFSLEECMTVEMFCAVEEPPEHARPFNEEHQRNAENIKFSEINGKRQAVTEDWPLSIELDATPQSKFRDPSGATTPEFLVISTPATKERARILRKRKCLFDDVIVFPNNVVKQYIEDASDLVSKRRKVPHTALASWKAHRVSNLPQSLFEPLIPCTSLEFRSLVCQKNLKIPESVQTVELPQKFAFECPVVGESIETVDPSQNLDVSEPHPVGSLAETAELMEKLNVPESPTVGRLVETMEHPEKSDMMIPESVGIVELPQKFVPECPTVGRAVEIVEPLEKFMSEFHTVGRSAETMQPLEKLNVSESPTVNRFVETVEPPENLDIAESPITGRSLEQMTIAPETPVKHTTLLRSFESPERPEISNTDSVRLGFEIIEKQPCPNNDNELDFTILNEEVNSCEEDSQDYYGCSERTRVVARCLNKSFLNQKGRREEELVNLLQLLEGRTKKESARLFYEILVLKSKGYVQVKQENAYGEILVCKTLQWAQLCSADCR